MENVQVILNFDNMIKQQAWKCLKKLNLYTMYEFEDLYNEGTSAICEQMKNYNQEKAGLSTFIFQVLISRYSNIVKSENKPNFERIDSDNEIFLDTLKYEITTKNLALKNSIEKAPIYVKQVIFFVLNPPNEFNFKRKIRLNDVFNYFNYSHSLKQKTIKHIRTKILKDNDI